MKQRCLNPKNPAYANYGGRGITICDEWKSFDPFYAYMGDRPDGMSIERIDVNGNYEPGNCRWATDLEQGRNKRNSRMIEFNGQKKCLSEWAEETGLKGPTISFRLKTWSVEKALTTPARRK